MVPHWPARVSMSRSEERRVGKECRSRWSPENSKKKKWRKNGSPISGATQKGYSLAEVKRRNAETYSVTISNLAGSQFFFFQAEDGIRDADVTGVQTCALPI